MSLDIETKFSQMQHISLNFDDKNKKIKLKIK